MDDIVDTTMCGSSRWDNIVQTPIIEQVSIKYKLKLKYGGLFRLARNSRRKVYCFGKRKCIYIDTSSYNLNLLVEEVTKHYPPKNDVVLSILFANKYAKAQTFIQLDCNDNFTMMLNMYEEEKEVTIYVTTYNHTQQRSQDKVINEPDSGNDSDSNCLSEDSYHSRHSSDDEHEMQIYEPETHSYTKNNPSLKKYSKFPSVIVVRRALNHYAITNEFEYKIEKSDLTRLTACCEDPKCEWRIHASVMEDKVTFQVKIFVNTHSCTRSNKCGNKRATQGWIANVVSDKLKSDGNVSVSVLMKWLMTTYNVDVPYMRVYRGKEQAYTDMYGKWEDSFIKMEDFKEELSKRNLGSVIEIAFETNGDKKHFQRFFICLAACSSGFLAGCRPYISLDACHLKGKFNGVLAAATSIDGNNNIFPVAYGVLESENTKSWEWFLESLKKAIGTPSGLVLSSDMQKGLEAAITQVYPNVEHRECMRHLYSNFKKHFRGEFFMTNLWGAANTYRVIKHNQLLDEIGNKHKDAIKFLNENHKKIWSRSKFGTASKCDYITNNISESFNSWIGEARLQPVLDLLDSIREKLMMRLQKKRQIVKKWKGTLVPYARKYLNEISKNLGAFQVCKSSENRAEVNYKGNRWEVILDKRECSCRIWQVKGLPCVHASAFIALTRDAIWEDYVDPYFTLEKFKAAYAFEIGPMPGKDEWEHINTSEKIYPPTIRRPCGRPKRNRIVAHDEKKKRHKCVRCGKYGHHQKTCKSSADANTSQAPASKRGRVRNTKSGETKNSKQN